MSLLAKLIKFQKHIFTIVFALYLVSYLGLLINIFFKNLYSLNDGAQSLTYTFFYLLMICNSILLVYFLYQLYLNIQIIKPKNHNLGFQIITLLLLLYSSTFFEFGNIAIFDIELQLNTTLYLLFLGYIILKSKKIYSLRNTALIANIQLFSIILHSLVLYFVPSLSLAYFLLLYYPFILIKD